jgi:hypothetical protein
VVRKRSRSHLVDGREAHIIFVELSNHYFCFALSGSRIAPVCADRVAQARQRAAVIKERELFIDGAATPP